MSGLSPKQMTVVRRLIDTAPDGVVRSLDAALSSEHLDGAMAEIAGLVASEALERLTRSHVFRPFTPLCRVAADAPYPTFPPQTITLLWNALKACAPGRVSLATATARYWMDSDAPDIFDALCADAAKGLRNPAGTPFAPATVLLDAAESGGADVFASYLDLAPLARETIRRLPDWLGRMNDERAVTIRLAYKDAVAVSPDAAPRFFDILCAQLVEPQQILRVISVVMAHPGDSYMAASELGRLGDRLLADIERHLNVLVVFDPWTGSAAGKVAADAVSAAVALITEFEQAMDLARDGPWGAVILKQRRILSGRVEKIMAKADAAAAAALPLRAARYGKGRGLPRHDNPPDQRAIMRARGLMAFVHHARNAAATGGYASFWTKTVERLDDRLDHYVEDVLEHLRCEDHHDVDHAAQFLEVAADLLSLLRGQKAAQIVRRRAAA